jgi:DNA-directed RNA polymerase specialized sigma24 family protein
MIDPTTNEDLALRAQAGDERAWDTLWLRLYAPLRNWIQCKGWTYHDAEEIAAEALAAVAVDLAVYDRARGTISSLVYTAAKGMAINRVRARNQLKRGGGVGALSLDRQEPGAASRNGTPEPTIEESLPSPTPSLEETVLWRETVREAWALVRAEGSGTQRHLFRVFVEQGDLSDVEVAAAMGTTRSTVAAALWRLRQQTAPRLDWQRSGSTNGAYVRPGTKRCTLCKTEQPAARYSLLGKRDPGKLHPWCNDCRRDARLKRERLKQERALPPPPSPVSPAALMKEV